MKLSGSQMVWIVVTQVCQIIGIRMTPAIELAKQDTWLSMLVGGCIGIALTLLVVHLSILHPNQTLTQFSQALLGKWLGRIIVLPYLISWYIFCAGLLREYPGFLQPILLDRTPLWIIMLLLLGLMIYLTYTAGITGIGRLSEFMGPVIMITLVVSFILNIVNADWHNLLPVYADSEWKNIVKGSLGPAFWFPGPFTLLVVIAFMNNPKQALSKSMLGVGITVFMVFASTLMVLMVFGPDLAAKIRFSYFLYVRTINVLNFIQNIDIFFMFIWIFGVTVQLSLYLFVASYELGQWLNHKNWRKLLLFIAPAIFIMAVMIPDETALTSYDKFWSAVVFPVCGIGIPLLLWILSIVKKKTVHA
ncbi:endospore germination permease [Paenibacillus sp. MWE-103]|uniref:Endospore germination permease n=1 Tax=Paenibacillus artemisiicola TaxID=1172618 RepID=A0ABS3W4E6_9BACL|nr:endospore germination permease [Paenibacillus artemisiicola]MBO7743173.1 endospore germination permease [Paenibacillus artemisiicola]